MKPRLELSGLKKISAIDVLLRFVFGGVVTVTAGYLGHRFGPFIGGVCLAFPAILPASITLVRERDGRKKATDDARGAIFGAVGLLAFALTLREIALHADAWLALIVATIAWLVVSVLLFVLRYGRQPE